MLKIKGFFIKAILPLFIFLLVYTRFAGLDWGLPHPMHPDERNMANAVQQLKCTWSSTISTQFSVKECFNPHFYAYGQFPLYLGYGIANLLKLITGDLFTQISFEEAALSLRIISAVVSILNVLVLIKLVELLFSKQLFNITNLISGLIFVFSPFFIQFSHFGTTESLLMLLYSLIVYFILKFWQNKIFSSDFNLLIGLTAGIAIATKVSSLFLLLVPITVWFDKSKSTLASRVLSMCYLLALTLIFSIFFSPHNFINFPDFLGAMKYESDVALGSYRAFYTRQFDYALPVFFQFTKIFPYVLGWPVFIFSLFGFIFLPYKKEINILRLAILAGFIPNAYMYAKWTRFVSPILPLLLLLAVLFILKSYNYLNNWLNSKLKIQNSIPYLKSKRFANFTLAFSFCVLILMLILPGISFLSIYQRQDIRYTVSEWVYKNIPEGNYILSETANVVDVPITNPKSKSQITNQIQNPNYEYISFNFYDLDENADLPGQLEEHLSRAQYIFVPSRRIFANHYCPNDEMRLIAESDLNFSLMQEGEKCEFVRKQYPRLQEYYDNLFSGKLGFRKVAEFSEFPKIQLFGKTILELSDEEAEETWTVFDHPVFRIYKKF